MEIFMILNMTKETQLLARTIYMHPMQMFHHRMLQLWMALPKPPPDG